MTVSRHFIYILECANNSLYTGYTIDLSARLRQHLSGKGGARFTRAFKPLELKAAWTVYSGKSDALKLEAFIKSLSRSQKTALTTDLLKLGPAARASGRCTPRVRIFNNRALAKLNEEMTSSATAKSSLLCTCQRELRRD